MAISTSSYLFKNSFGTFYFRSIIPKRLRQYFPNYTREIRRSLHTKYKQEAAIQARALRVEFDKVIYELDMSKKKNKKNFKAEYIEFFPGNGKSRFKVDTGDVDKDLEHAKELMEHQAKLAKPNADNDVDESAILFSELVSKYIFEKQNKSKLLPKTLSKYEASFKSFIFIIGNLPINSLSVESFENYYEGLTKLPKQYTVKPMYKGQSYSSLKSLSIPKRDKLSISTINGRYESIQSLFNFAYDKDLISKNLAKSVTLVKDQKRDKDKREPFTREDLNTIFESSHYVAFGWRKGRNKNESYKYWLPLIAIFTGARLSEICGLRKNDVKQSADGVWVIDIKEEYDDEGRRIKSVKNSNSIRTVPLSDALIDIGFIEYNGSLKKNSMLFPELEYKKNSSDTAGKWANRFLKRCGVHKPQVKTFHSFRHTFANLALSSGADAKYVGACLGHLSSQEFHEIPELAKTYFKGYPPNVLKENVIDMIDSPFDIQRIKWVK